MRTANPRNRSPTARPGGVAARTGCSSWTSPLSPHLARASDVTDFSTKGQRRAFLLPTGRGPPLLSGVLRSRRNDARRPLRRRGRATRASSLGAWTRGGGVLLASRTVAVFCVFGLPFINARTSPSLTLEMRTKFSVLLLTTNQRPWPEQVEECCGRKSGIRAEGAATPVPHLQLVDPSLPSYCSNERDLGRTQDPWEFRLPSIFNVDLRRGSL